MADNLGEAHIFNELQTALDHVNAGRALGHEKLTYNEVCNLPTETKARVLEIINEIWETGSLLQDWKSALFIPILKYGKKPDAPVKLRLVSLTSNLGKLMERMAVARLQWFLEK